MPALSIDGFEIVGKLGSGGMAEVHVAYKQGVAGFKRPVVLKRIQDRHAGKADFRQMFVDEARLASRIQHRSVVRVEELAGVGDDLFMVMEYVHGVHLGKLLAELAGQERRLTPAVAVAIVCEAADGLHAAHETRDDDGELLNIVHRDISPQNIMLATNGAIKVIDFGIAKARKRLHKTMGDGVKGKVRYMSPEQLNGTVDRRADLFALGVVLWELLTNRRLFMETEDVVIRRIMEGDIPPPSHFADVPEALDSLVMKILSVDPRDRPATGRAMRRALRKTITDPMPDDTALAALLTAIAGSQLEDRALRMALPPMSALNTEELEHAPLEALTEFTLSTVAPTEVELAGATTVRDAEVAPPGAVEAQPPRDALQEDPRPSLRPPAPGRSRLRLALVAVMMLGIGTASALVVREVTRAPESSASVPAVAPLPLVASPVPPPIVASPVLAPTSTPLGEERTTESPEPEISEPALSATPTTRVVAMRPRPRMRTRRVREHAMEGIEPKPRMRADQSAVLDPWAGDN